MKNIPKAVVRLLETIVVFKEHWNISHIEMIELLVSNRIEIETQSKFAHCIFTDLLDLVLSSLKLD